MRDELHFLVDEGQAGQRLDVFLARLLPEQTRSQLKQWIADGAVEVAGRSQKAGYRIQTGQEIRVLPPVSQPSRLIAESIPLDILYEDDAIVVVHKPAGLVVHPGAGNPSGTLANALLYHLGESAGLDPLRPGIVHRLDKETSGVLIVAKNPRVQEKLAAQFRRREVDKRYLALVYGRVESRTGTIDLPIGRHPRQRTRISTRSRKLRPARTSYRVIKRFDDFSLLDVRLHTGRTHQIRVHLQHLGHPVVGDAAYAGGSSRRLKDARTRSRIEGLRRHFLHAWKLALKHPNSGQDRRFRACLPRDLAKLLQELARRGTARD